MKMLSIFGSGWVKEILYFIFEFMTIILHLCNDIMKTMMVYK
jgi:hypothetical protein